MSGALYTFSVLPSMTSFNRAKPGPSFQL